MNFCDLNDRLNLEIVYLFSDSGAAINAVHRCTGSVRPDTYRSLLNLRELLNIRLLLVKINEINGHSDILGNDIADKEAKLVATQMSESKIVLQDEGLLSVCEAYRILSDIAHKSWQRHWDNESTGRYTYNLIPVVGTKVTFSKVRHVDIAYCRMLLNDTMLMKDSFRSGTSDTALCQCGKAEESVEHFLFHCEYYEKDRKVMMDNVLDIVDSGKSKRSLRITDELLLAPTFDDISKRKMLLI